MNRFYLIFTFIIAYFVVQAIEPVQLEAKAKKHSKAFKKAYKSTKNYKYSKKSKKFKAKKQTLSESLQKLEKYFPGYDYETNSFNENIIKSLELVDNTVFKNEEFRIKLLDNINDWLQTPYRHAGRSKNGIDCSNFTSVMVNNTLGIKFPSSPGAQTQYKNVEIIKNLEDLQFGDLIFFSGRNRKSNRIGHVGFYIGNGLFAHSSSGRGVIYTHISESYYTPRYRFGGRIIQKENLQNQANNQKIENKKIETEN